MPVKVKKGIEDIKEPHYVEFGKFIIHMDFLNANIFLVKYKSYAPTKLKRRKVSDLFVSILQDVINNKSINYELISNLKETEKDLFNSLMKSSGVDKVLKYNAKKTEDNAEKLKNKFNIIRGSIIAGNDNPENKEDLIIIVKKLYQLKEIDNEKMNNILDIIKEL